MTQKREMQKTFGLPASSKETEEAPEVRERRLYAKLAELMADKRRLEDQVRQARAAADPRALAMIDGFAAAVARARDLEAERDRWRNRAMMFEGGFHASRDAILIADPVGRVRAANAAAEQMFGELSGADVKSAVLERVTEPVGSVREDSVVGRRPLPHGYRLWEKLNGYDLSGDALARGHAAEAERIWRDGVEDNVEIRSADNRLLDVKLSMSFARDRNGHPLHLFVSVTNIEAAFRDGLTGLCLRRTFYRSLERKIAERERAVLDGRVPAPLVVLMADIDHFKGVNDAFGHLAGDKAIRHVASLLSAHFQRATDLVARLGGEEFGGLMDMPLADACDAAERFRRAVEMSAVRSKELPKPFTVTVSAGLAEWRSGMTGHELAAAADAELYRSKNGGRNRVSTTRMRTLTPPDGVRGLGKGT